MATLPQVHTDNTTLVYVVNPDKYDVLEDKEPPCANGIPHRLMHGWLGKKRVTTCEWCGDDYKKEQR